MAECGDFNPWTKVVNNLIVQITETIDPETFAKEALQRKLLSTKDERFIRRMMSSGRNSDEAVNSQMIDKMRGSGVDGYKSFKEILGKIDASHRELLHKINEQERTNLTEEQRKLLSPPEDEVEQQEQLTERLENVRSQQAT